MGHMCEHKAVRRRPVCHASTEPAQPESAPNSSASYQQCSKRRGNEERKQVAEGERGGDNGVKFLHNDMSVVLSVSLEFFITLHEDDTGPLNILIQSILNIAIQNI